MTLDAECDFGGAFGFEKGVLRAILAVPDAIKQAEHLGGGCCFCFE